MNEFSTAHLSSRQWSRRGYLPHFQGSAFQFLTYRLNDSLPNAVLAKLERRLQHFPEVDHPVLRYRAVETLLDAGHGSCVLRNAECAEIVVNTWKHFDGDRYELLEWVVMPNHVHVLIRVFDDWELHKILQSWKSYSAKEILKVVAEGTFPRRRVWQRGYFDRIIRDEEHYKAIAFYIRDNPRRAGLVEEPNEWVWSSVGE